jgi:hypothetical protein
VFAVQPQVEGQLRVGLPSGRWVVINICAMRNQVMVDGRNPDVIGDVVFRMGTLKST